MRFPDVVLLSACAAMLALPLLAQSPNGVINGLVVDPSNRVIAEADLIVVNDVTGVKYTTQTNNEGIYVLPNLPPGPYRLQVSKVGFKTVIKPDIILNVQDALAINFTLPVGALSETVTVEGGAPLVNTESATVSTVVDRTFAENLPMNGRSFQTLIDLTPGVILTPSTLYDSGQFSVNGQRAISNYWTVDGVGANIGVGVNVIGSAGNALAGGLGSFSAQGGTNSLVSVDALQEFRVQTSTYAPEFGRTPGAQISIVTRSGTNQFHGSAFDYLRNDIFDANDWFNGYTNNPVLPKAEERQNDFGGTFSGPILKDRTFFFFSYEGLRLRLPQTTLTTVPDLNARQNAIAALRPYLNAFPVPNEGELGSGIAAFNASFSNSSTLDAYSIRLDHRFTDKVAIFGRYNYSPSQVVQRGNEVSLSAVSPSRITTQTATVGTTWLISPLLVNDLRFNYSRTDADSYYYLDAFGGAIPLASFPFPKSYTTQNAGFFLGIFSLSNGYLAQGTNGRYVQRQINIVDNISLQRGSHSLKFGVDFRRLAPLNDARLYQQIPYFQDVPSAEGGNLLFGYTEAGRNGDFLFRNLGMFAQDVWHVAPRLTLTYGLRWEVDFVPSSSPSLPAVTGFDLTNFSQLALAPPGTPVFKTTYGNVAPRFGAAYQFSQKREWATVLRSGFGVFYDLATSEVGNMISATSYPFGALNFISGGEFPLSSAAAAPPAITPAGLTTGNLAAFDPHLKLPYTLQWNVALEQALGNQQTLSVSYIGAVGRRLIQTAYISSPNPNFGSAQLVDNTANSNYNALQIQFRRRLSFGLQALASYTWSHSIDTGSAGSYGDAANTLVPALGPDANRGPSDFDCRNAFSLGLTYEVPVPRTSPFASAILHGWSLQSIIQARSANPVNVYDGSFSALLNAATQIRPDEVPGQPLYIYGAQYPGGMAFNRNAFADPPTDPTTGAPLRQGDLGRNALIGFGTTQWDFAVHRDFPIHDSLKLQFRAELFNILNHPNFAAPVGNLNTGTQFGQSVQMLGQSLGGANVGGGGFSALYQVGGPRSMQFALKFLF